MIIRSKDKVQVNGKNKPVWVLDTDALTVTHNTPDAEPNVTQFSSDHIKYHLHYSAEYRPARLKTWSTARYLLCSKGLRLLFSGRRKRCSESNSRENRHSS